MHEAIDHLKKKIDALRKELDALASALAEQAEREGKALDAIEYGPDFDEEAALPQETIVEALQDALEGAEEARDALLRASEALKGAR